MDWEHFYRHYRNPGFIPGYEILNKLGSGVFGEVYKLRKTSIGKFYAVKFLRVEDEALRNAVVRELESVKLLAQVDHPNLVSIEDQGEVEGIPYIVMSYAGDRTLKRVLEDGPLPANQAADCFGQICAGVEALHERSIVHFDLKPANIYLKDAIARVGDYGLSKLVSQTQHSLSFGRGTPYYMAPEMLKRRGDHRSDIYSLGVILFECLCGEVPFRGDTEWEVLRKHESEEIRFPAAVVEPFRSAIRQAMAKAPEDRFSSVAALRQAVTPAAPTSRAKATAAAPPPGIAEHFPPAPGAAPPVAAASPAAHLVLGPVRLVVEGVRQAAGIGWAILVALVQIPLRLLAWALHVAVFLVMVLIFFIVLHLLFKIPLILVGIP
ncbi:MAG: serine/threonine protein kinase [Planctomycetes bacterium]|nr:serine/threonine protein kinase [Planctomycetota bacterium]